jgi:hypothetical protein
MLRSQAKSSQISQPGGKQSQMVNTLKSLIPPLLLAGIILLAGCSGSPSNPSPPPVQTPVQAAGQPTAPPTSQSPASIPGTADNVTPVAVQPQSIPPNRVDVIYFHVNQRCVTCLCFEQQVNHVIEAYFGDAITSGKLTYRVLNIQKSENAAIARKYGAVGSQLFINTVVNSEDKIEDIQDIWNWNCRNNAPGFDLKVRSVIDYSLKGLK